jgi:protein-L-isoaspartate(D-aspartate) O-methyltransferase
MVASVFIQPKEVSPSDFGAERLRMVERDLSWRGIDDKKVLEAMLKVPRHLFVLPDYSHLAYADSALPINEDQTISQPYVVALMTQSARLRPTDKVLEIGTGSGYQAAVLSEIVKEVYSIEIIKELAEESSGRLRKLGYNNVTVKHGDGYKGWKEHAPFDAILITAAAPKIPQPLVDQLKIGGRMVLPVGKSSFSQNLVLLVKEKDGLQKKIITGVRFVPMTGEVRK